ncbi:MAG TPA: hypothetical protein VM032_15430 [Vicinamibacterales bacterium]|nr:hypothetical protein [Vicinamibacterales bacterium]
MPTFPPPSADAPSRDPRPGGRAAAAALALFVGLAVIHLWPLASAPGTLSRNDNGDFILHEWIMAWVAHQVVTNPLHLFDANIFYPEPGTLSYSDHLFVQSMLGAPLLWAGASPVLVHNLVLMAGFALTGWTTCLVMRRWTGSWTAAVGSGSLVAFNAFSLTRLPQIQDLHLEFFPLTLLALDRLLGSPRLRHALSLAGWFVLQSLTGTYLMVFTSLSLVAAAAARPTDWIGPRARAVAGYTALSAVLAIVVLTPFLLPYYRASAEVGLGRSLEETQRFSAELTDYFAAAGRLHFDILRWSRPYFQGDALFPGFVGLALAIVGMARSGVRDTRVRMLVVIAVVSFALSFGPAFPPYRVLYRVYPLLTGIRGAVRFGQFTLAAIGMLAGFGIAVLQRRLAPRLSMPLCLALVVAVNGEALRAPLGYTEYRGIPPIYDALTQIGSKSVLVFFPFYDSSRFHLNAPLMLATTKSFQPMLNGYSGFKPASYYEHVRRLATFPDQASIDYLRTVGVTHVLVDGRNMRPAQLEALPSYPELHLWQTDGNLRIYLLTAK